jgi:hypothetical protein
VELGISYFGNRILRYVKQDLAAMKEMGATYVVHTFSENDQIFYKDTMGEIVAATKDVGLQTWIDPWGVGRVFGGEAFSHFAACNHDATQVASDGKTTHAACPNNPKFREFMLQWIDDAAATGAEVAFWDEPHFYMPNWLGGREGTWGCVCPYCREKWQERYPGRDLPTEPTDEWNEAKEDWMVEFLDFLTTAAAERGLKNAVCMLPPSPQHEGAAENWEKIASLPHVHNIGTDPYWIFLGKDYTIENYVRPNTQRIIKMAKDYNIDAHMWLQAFRIPAGREAELQDAMRVFIEEKCPSLAVWGFDACEHISWIRPDRPKVVWENVKESFKMAQQ